MSTKSLITKLPFHYNKINTSDVDLQVLCCNTNLNPEYTLGLEYKRPPIMRIRAATLKL